ncbi:PKD domain-containing protein, partial [Arthrospira platensis SPKY1]|nr:PKD domain-containing protein [Arthrospira platensis SPKY1]
VFIGDPLFKWKAQSSLVYLGGSGPSAEANGPYSVNEGTPITFQGSGSGDVTNWEWDLNGDSIYETLGQNPTKTYTDNLSITVRLRVTNAQAQTATDTAPLTVSNVAPSLTAVAVEETSINPG